MAQDRKMYMRDFQRQRRLKKNVRLLCIELFDKEEHALLEQLKYHAEKQSTTIRDLVVLCLREALG